MKHTFLYGLILIFAACSGSNHESIYWVNSYRVDCVGVGPMKCMLIKKGADLNEGEWLNFYSRIEGFDYEPGFIYKLKVKEEQLKNVPADASSIKYSLIEILEKEADPKVALTGDWDLVKMNGEPFDLPEFRGTAAILPKIHIDYLDMQISGVDGCNNFSGKIKAIDDSSIEWGPLAATGKMCPDMTLANAFSSTFNEVKQYRLGGDKLSFLDEQATELLEFTRAAEAKVLLNDIWVAEFIDGTDVTDKTNAPRLEINSSEMMAMGTDGCNNFNGKITKLTNSELTFGPLAGTRKMCPDMEIPDKFNRLLPLVRAYKIGNLKLSLLDEQNQTLIILKKTD